MHSKNWWQIWLLAYERGSRKRPKIQTIECLRELLAKSVEYLQILVDSAV